jgi:glycerate-2-kinase
VTLAISDIPGDNPAAIASGPTVADSSTLVDVREIIARYNIDMPPAASAVLTANNETPKTLPEQNIIRVFAAPSLALVAAAQAAVEVGLTPLILGDAIEGESRELVSSWQVSPVRAVSTDFQSNRRLFCCQAVRRPSRSARDIQGAADATRNFCSALP